MAEDDQFVKVKLRLYAEIQTEAGLVKFDDIVSMSATFGLNAIPTASMVVAVGKDHRRNKVATIHKDRPKLKPRDPVKVFLKMIPESGKVEKIKGQKYKIFEGYLSGVGYQRSHNSANFTINVVHWLDDLNNSSALTGNWMPGSAYDLAQAAVNNALAPGGGGVALPTAQLDPSRIVVTIDNVNADIWEKVIKPLFIETATWAFGREQSVPASGKLEPTNAAAIGKGKGVLPPGALNRMPGDGAKYYKPVGIDVDGLGQNVEDAIRHSLQIVDARSFAYTTFWNKLIGECAPQFFFAVSPAVQWALPIPFFAALRGEYKTILAEEYSYANFNANMSQMLESVDVFYPANSSPVSEGGLCGVDPPGLRYPIGFYPKDEEQLKRGLKLYKEPPAWLTNLGAFQRNAPGATGEGGQRIGCGAFPNAGTQQSVMQPPGVIISQLKAHGIADYLAEHWFKSELLYQRYGEMSGYLRFDIAPGSIIRIETPPRDIQWYESQDHYMYATVTQVSYSINAERAMAGTAFSLAHIRTLQENFDDRITSTQSPLFNSFWDGAPLADPNPPDWPGWIPEDDI